MPGVPLDFRTVDGAVRAVFGVGAPELLPCPRFGARAHTEDTPYIRTAARRAYLVLPKIEGPKR